MVLVVADRQPADATPVLDGCADAGVEAPLAPADERRCRVIHRPALAAQRQRAVRHRRHVGGESAHGDPLGTQDGIVEVIVERRGIDVFRRHHRCHHRPTVDPLDVGGERLPAERREAAGHPPRAHPEEHGDPRPVRRLEEVAVAGVLDRPVGAAGAQHRVVRARLERPGRRRRAGDADAVAALGAALGDHQVPPVPDAIQVWRFREHQPAARPQRPRRLEGPPAARGRRRTCWMPRWRPRSGPERIRPE